MSQAKADYRVWGRIVLFSALTLCISTAKPANAWAGQCNDGIDNDGDGNIDALVELSAANGQTYELGRSTIPGHTHQGDPMVIRSMVNNRQPLFGYTPIRSDGALNNDAATALAVCNIAGYRNVTARICSSIYDNGRCNWHSEHDNTLQYWNGYNFITIFRPYGYTWISIIGCRDKLAACSDGIDNDGDGARDYPADNGCASANDDSERPHDPGCTGPDDPSESAQCGDGVDNDGDGATDFGQDFSCSSAADDDETNPKAQCQDGADNDGDGLWDLTDPGCTGKQDNSEDTDKKQCQDGIDNDGDGATDFGQDFSCSSALDNDETNPKAQCQDGADNDGDGLWDLTDPGCTGKQDNSEDSDKKQCQDGIDNDGDGATDFGQDFSCSSALDNDETNPKAQCQDGADNDGDGLWDLTDPGCTGKQDNSENSDKKQCQDGIDNDGDGAADFGRDFSCSSALDNDETNPKSQCQDGLDNDGDGLWDTHDPGCSSNQDNSEDTDKKQCQDGIDNDGDGAVDYPADFSCSSALDNNESDPKPQCQDGQDNDVDGKTDLVDPGCSNSQDNDESDDAALKPAAPVNLSASDGASENFVAITWGASARTETYELFRSEYQGDIGRSIAADLAGTSYEDRSAVPGVTYYYAALARNQHGESSFSNVDSGFRKSATGEDDSDGDGVHDDQEEIDGTDPNDRGSFQLHLKSPAFTKYNTFLKQWNFLELIASGTKTITAKVTVFLLNGTELASKQVVIDPQTQVDVDINSMIAQACSFGNLCSGFADLDRNGIIDTYGVVRIDFNNKLAGETLMGRMSNYRQDKDGKNFSFAFAKELRNPTRGITHATGNTYDPQGAGFLVPNWVEVINLDSKPQQFDYKLFNQEGVQLLAKTVTVAPLGESDLHGGHEIVNSRGKVLESVYLAEVSPHDGAAPYFATVSRYSSNSPAGVEPESYNFAFALDGRAGNGTTQYMTVSNETGACYLQTNWVEVVNVREKPITVTVIYRGIDGKVIQNGAVGYELKPRSQFHFNAGAMMPKGAVGSVELLASDKGALIAQSLVYYHDCSQNKVQTAFVSQGRIAGRDVQAGTINTFLGMTNKMRIIGTTPETTVVAAELRTFDGGAPKTAQFELSAFGTTQIESSSGSLLNIQADRYGALTLRNSQPLRFTAEVLRIRPAEGGRIDFAMPTVVQ